MISEILKLGQFIEQQQSKLGSFDADQVSRLAKMMQNLEDKRLRELAQHLNPDMSLRHFLNCLVPFERALDKSVTDDKFLIADSDRLEGVGQRLPIEFALENIRSAFNVGSILRMADCVGASQVHTVGYTAGPDSDQVKKSALGAEAVVPNQRQEKISTVIADGKARGLRIYALETAEKAKNLYHFDFTAPCLMIVGNERFGLGRETLNQVDECLQIPCDGVKNSLNVAVALSIAAFEWKRQWLRQEKQS